MFRKRLKFTCKICKRTGYQLVSMVTPFVHAFWYTDRKGINHGFLYCRSCGAVHDTIGSFLAPIKLIFRRFPSKVVVVYEISAFKKLLRINNPDFITPARMPRVVGEAMIEDGRLSWEEDLIEASPQADFLLECLTDNSFIVRREAIIALRRFEDKQAVDPLIEALKDKHWDVRRNAAITLGEIGDTKAIEPLNELLRREGWEHLVVKEAQIALKRLKGEIT